MKLTEKIKKGLRKAIIYSLISSFALGNGCSAINVFRKSAIKHPEITVYEYGFDINEKSLEKKISESITYDGSLISSISVYNEIKKQLDEEIKEDVIVNHSLTDFIKNNYLSKRDEGLGIYLSEFAYSEEEIKEILKENDIGYIKAVTDSTVVFPFKQTAYTVITEKGQELLEDKIKEKYPNRIDEKEKELEKQYGELVETKTNELIDNIKQNKKLFICLNGQVTPFDGNFQWYRNELKLNEEKLSEFFNKKKYTQFNIDSNEEQFKTLLKFINEYSNKDYNLVIFYHRHGIEKGFSLIGDVVEPQEIEDSLNDFKGKTTIFANCCFSGNVKDYFEKNKSDITVISASKNGETVLVNDHDKPGYLVEDLLKSDLDLKNFEKYFKDVPEGKYYPEIYAPSK